MEYKEIENQDIYGKPGEQDIFGNVVFVNCNFIENLEGSKFIKCRFDKCMFLKDLKGSKFTTCFFDKCNLETEFNGSKFYKCNITRSRLYCCEGNNFDNIVFEECEFSDVSIETNYSKNVAFSECKFLETDIELRDISDSEIIDCYFRDCNVFFTEENDEYTTSKIAPCTIIFNNFTECEFSYSRFPENFVDNIFIDGCFDDCQFKKITSCSFYNCDLEEMLFPDDNQYNNYRMCNFKKSDFTNKDLSKCTFYENKYQAAIFNNTVFNKESSREILLLTEGQINGIIIKE